MSKFRICSIQKEQEAAQLLVPLQHRLSVLNSFGPDFPMALIEREDVTVTILVE